MAMTQPPVTDPAPRRRPRWLRAAVVAALLVTAGVAGAAFAWTHYEPYHRAQRDADRVFRALTRTDPARRERAGTYIGDQPPTGQAYGPLPGPTTVRDEMARFRSALTATGYRPTAYADNPRVWCSLSGDPFYLPNAAPATVPVRCSVDGTSRNRRSHASITLAFQVPPDLLHPTRSPTGYLLLAADNAVDLTVSSGSLEVSVQQDL